jgi:hypothetical protein
MAPALLTSVLLIAACGLVYELIAGTLASATERRGANAPRSVRENPGAYRSVYRGSARYRLGK